MPHCCRQPSLRLQLSSLSGASLYSLSQQELRQSLSDGDRDIKGSENTARAQVTAI